MKIRARNAKSDEATAAEALQAAETQADSGSQEGGGTENPPPPEANEVRGADVPAEDAGAVETIGELRTRAEKLEDSLLRAKADYQNLQRRSDMERSDAIRYSNTELMRSLLVVIDDFERSLAAAEDSGNLKAVVDGVHLVYENFVRALRNHGLESIEALHRPFDPNVHEALLQQPSADHPPGTVVEQVAKGYRLFDRVVRPAKVIVSRAPDSQGVSDEQTPKAGESEGESEDQ